MRLSVVFTLVLMSLCLRAQQPQIMSVQVLKMPAFQYDLLELRAEIGSIVKARYDYDSIVFGGRFIGPEGDTVMAEGFYYQHFIRQGPQLVSSGTPHFRLRFTPDKPGTWTYNLFVSDSYGSNSTEPQTFTLGPSANDGFLRFTDGSNYLHNSRGEAVFLAGENIAWANLPDGGDAMTYYLLKLHEHKMNFAKLMMTPWAYQIEWNETGWRNYGGRQLQAFMMDSIFRMADNLGIYLQLAFSIHNELNIGYPAEDWTSNPYNIANGGCCNEPWEFFSHPAAQSAFQNRLRYLAARWGYSTRLFGWELLSEADNFPWYGTHQQSIANWSHSMAGFLRARDQAKRAVSVGFALSSSNPLVWQSPDIGFTQIHHYKKTSDIEGEVAALQATYLNKFKKPVLTGEFGLGHVGDSLVVWDPDGLALHNSLWTSAMTGAFGGVTPWFWENYIDVQQLYHLFTPVEQFMNRPETKPHELVPTHLPSTANSYLPVTIEPRFDVLQKSPSRQFRLNPTGLMMPTQDSLPVFLFGPQSVLAGLRNPPEFSGTWQQAGIMRIFTGPQAINALLQVKIDGTIWLEINAQGNNEYLLMVPSGEHTISVDNKGQGLFSILEISKIIFENVAPALRAFGLTGQQRALAWVHNRSSHWQNVALGGSIAPVSGQVMFPSLQGTFRITFFNTRSGEVDSVAQLSSGANGLTVSIPQLQNDVALRIEPIPVAIDEGKWLVPVAFPNPFHHQVRILLPELATDELLRLEILDFSGKLIFHANNRNVFMEGFLWDGRTNTGTQAAPGVYFFRLVSSHGYVYGGKLVKW